MEATVLFALGVSTAIYVGIGLLCGARISGPADIIPLMLGRAARVENHREFASSTVAATVSLATVMVAFFELVPVMGAWLFWTAVTTSMGLLVFGMCARRVWRKMASYEVRPTLHAYLGTEFASPKLALVASIFTTAGYLSAFAVELTVGSRFLAQLLPGIAPLTVVGAIALVSFTYTALGGFRAVVITDRIQMWFIWLLIASLLLYAIVALKGDAQVITQDATAVLAKTPPLSAELMPFLLGIAVMNLFTYLSNMGLWQRISGSEKAEVIIAGLWSSVWVSVVAWSLLVVVALAALMIVAPVSNESLLVTLIKSVPATPLGQAITFCVTLGLYGALLSTASTQLIALSHTIYEDIIAPFRRVGLVARIESNAEARWSRWILVVSAISAVIVMEGLQALGFTVADLAFAVYGAALGLVPPIFLTLFMSRETTQRLSVAATWAVGLGFVSCWSVAAYGRAIGDGNMIFLSPIVSLAIATIAVAIGWFFLMRPQLVPRS
jgi:sodium/pantothenate symporter